MRSPRPTSRSGPESPDRASAAARRLAMLAADLGAAPPATSDESEPVADAGDDLWWADHTRVVSPREDTAPAPHAVPAAPSEDPVPALPRPGRHASRRVLRLPGLVPGIGAAHLAVIAVAVAVALAATTWWLLRDRPEPVPPTPSATATSAEPLVPASGAGAEDAASPAADEGRVTVDVAGKVRRPGIVVLAAGARVVDALEAAGGARKGVDTTGINLARVLVDGEQIVVGKDAAAPAPPGGAASGASGEPGTPVNLNLADQTLLETLPQVGPVTAAAIIAWRDEHGGFSSVEQLVEVDGIGEKTLEQIAPHATV